MPLLDSIFRLFAFLLLALAMGTDLPSLRRSSPERRAMLPVIAIFSVWVLGSTLYGLLPIGTRASQLSLWILYVGRGIFPLSFLAGLLGSRTFSGQVLETLLRDPNVAPDDDQAARLAKVLEDPGLTLGFWLPTTGEFVDAEGHRVELPPADSGRKLTELRRGGQLIGAVVSDPALAQNPELLDAASSAVGMVIENRRLLMQLRQSRDELGASRRETVAVVEAERRRIERDLHDSVQQQLLALGMRLAVIRGLTQNDVVRDRLMALSGDLELAMQELRAIARGTLPTTLHEQGLVPALVEVARRAPLPVSVSSRGTGHCPPEVEEALYFCCLEALQNAQKHGGDDVHVRIDIGTTDDAFLLTVRDTGQGFDTSRSRSHSGAGLGNMSDRMKAVGGYLEITSEVGRGTTVSVRVPRPVGAPTQERHDA
jgi:signal transduction histidine kinase